jgi:hypothetical protein
MRTILNAACAIALVATTFGATLLPANAAPVQALYFGGGTAQLIQVQQRHDGNHGGFERRGNDGYYNGHRGSRERHPGYREQNGFWFPPEAFATGVIGAIIGGAIAGQTNNQHGATVRLSQQHVDWCESRYRSYRTSDNTFQPNHGPRQVCASPYMR